MEQKLFRGKRTDGGGWIEGYYAMAKDILTGKWLHIIFHVDLELYPGSEFCYYEEVDPETVGQYVGLRDQYGKRIFEGDILESLVKRAGEPHGNLVVIKDIRECKFAALYVAEYSVVGNIHDNPELLEV